MIYELDKPKLLRLWSVLSPFGEIRETKDPIGLISDGSLFLTLPTRALGASRDFRRVSSAGSSPSHSGHASGLSTV